MQFKWREWSNASPQAELDKFNSQKHIQHFYFNFRAVIDC